MAVTETVIINSIWQNNPKSLEQVEVSAVLKLAQNIGAKLEQNFSQYYYQESPETNFRKIVRNSLNNSNG